jgi:hypothetical protein
MKKILERPYEKDEYFKKWLVGLSERTKENYSKEFHDWFVFIGMMLLHSLQGFAPCSVGFWLAHNKEQLFSN